MKSSFAPVLAAALALGGCTLDPHYSRPALPVDQTWPATVAPPAGASADQTQALASDLPWREVFTDPGLQRVIDLALRQNRDLRVAVLNIEQARALYRIQRADLLPQINAVATEPQQRSAAGLSQNPTGARYSRQASVELDVASYEVDLFGRVRSLTREAQEQFFSVEENRRAAQISLIAQTAAAYLTLAADQDLLRLSDETLKARQDTYDLTKRSFDAGAASELDLRQVETLAEQARADRANYQAVVEEDKNALRLLAGADLPEDALPKGGLAGVQLRQTLPAGLDSTILVGRPDVLAYEHKLKAMNADIGAARAAFFPRITLTGSGGTASLALSGLFKPGSDTWSFSPQIQLPIFAGGANLANLRYAEAGRDIAVANYEKAVQTAFREVADALAVRSTIDDRTGAQSRLVAAAEATQRLSQLRFDSGADSYLSVLDAQRTYYQARQGEVTVALTKAQNLVNLYKALGGGGRIDPGRG